MSTWDVRVRGHFFLGRFRHTYTFHMLDLKTIQSVLGEFEERGISKETMIDAIESAMATAYKKEYGKRAQVVRAVLDMNTGTVAFEQVKTVVDETMVRFPEEGEAEPDYHPHRDYEDTPEGELPRYDAEKHIMLEDARRIRRDAGEPLGIARDLGIDLAVGPFEVGVRDHRGAAVPRPRNENHVEIELANHAV